LHQDGADPHDRQPRALTLGIREVDDQVWLVSFLEHDLGYLDRDQDRVEPGPNPFAPDTVLTMCPE
jgi:putative transposase